nr:unnamed protein product [Callosobruchus analis]
MHNEYHTSNIYIVNLFKKSPFFNCRPTNSPPAEDRKTTLESENSTPLLGISLSNAPIEFTTPAGFNKPMFRPKPSSKPSEDKFVLVPTISHDTSRPNKTQEYNSIVNILNMLNNTSTNRPFLSSDRTTTSSITRVPDYKITSRQPPSTSYVFSTTIPPRRTTTTKNTRPTKKKQTSKPTKKPTTSYIYSLAPTKTTFANSPSAFITSARPPSSSYSYSSSQPTRRPIQTSQVSGPGFTVTSSPIFSSKFPTPAPTVIVLGPITDNDVATEEAVLTTYEQRPVTFSRPTQVPQRKPPVNPVNHVTINNHVTQNIYSTSERPSPTVLITPKPSISSTLRPQEDQDTVEVVSAAPSPEDVNFPPVRHPNLNLSIPAINEDDITTPIFIEDEALNANMESFVNKIIFDLQGPFNDLKDIVYNRNKTSSSVLTLNTTTKKPVKKQGTTSAGTTTKRPVSTNRPTRYPATTLNTRPVTTSRPVTTKKTTVRRSTTSLPTRRPVSTTTKKVKATTRRPITTTQSFIEHSTEPIVIDSDDYRTQCGIRPLVDRNGRIVGGKGAAFGEFPWQVLVRESTWLGLFTKNKCGGVLISHRYVMTAAHCQPGFLASLVAVFGEFDISGDLESKKPISRNVKRVIVHRQYDAATFENDLALLELEQPVQFDSHIIPICLPRDGDDFTGRMATVTGWGRLKYGGGVPAVLQEVQVPIMENHVCQEMFRTAGHSKVILDSFLCAGYANGQKDSCEGDSGGPLVLLRPDGRYQLAGTVSHGIKCAAPYLPGVYMRTQYFKPWITSITGVTSP